MKSKKPSHGQTNGVLACIVLLLSGCDHLGAASRVDPASIAIYPGGESRDDPRNSDAQHCLLLRGVGSYSPGAVDLDCFVFPEDRRRDGVTDTSTVGQLAYRRAAAGLTERNRLTALLLKHSDDICVAEMGRLNANEATVNTSLSILGTGATTAANIVTGNLAQEILTGVGTLAGASRSHINAYVYRNTFAYAVSRAIALERLRLRALIEARYSAQLADFTVDDAIRAANEYHGVCSFYKGLELVLASVEGDQRSRDAQARQLQLDQIDQEIRRLQDAMDRLQESDKTPFREAIARLVARRTELVLAASPALPTSGAQNPNQVSTPPEPQAPAPNPQPGAAGANPYPGQDSYEGSDKNGVGSPLP